MALTVNQYVGQAAAAALQGAGTYGHESAVQASLTADYCLLPLVVLYDFTVNQKATSDRVARADLTMYFGTAKPGAGDSAELEQAAVAEMVALKRQFLAALDRSPVVEVTNMRATPFHDAYAAKLSGVGLQFTLGVPAAALLEECLPAVLGPMVPQPPEPPPAIGVPTMLPPATASAVYPFVNQMAFNVVHNFGRLVQVTIYNQAGDEINGDVSYPSLNETRISFSQPLSGTVLVR